MTANSSHSVHSLVRLLKSSADPPSAPGLSKIEIACLAWSDPSFRAANKAEVIGEWVLSLLGQAKKTGQEKDTSSSFDSIADSRYWTLLGAVLTTPPPTAARPIKVWLLPLLNRFQLATIVVELITLRSSELLASARPALTVLWPLAEKKIAVDVLTECLGAVFNACMDWHRVDDNLAWICSAVVAAYRNALANAGNKKKLYISFVNAYLSPWLSTISRVGPSSTKQLQGNIYVAGTDTLFSLDALKQPLNTLFDALSSSISSPFPVLPDLCAAFLCAIQRHRAALFVAATALIGGKEEVRKKGMDFVGRCWTLVRDSSSDQGLGADKWKSVIGVLRIVEKERLFVIPSVRGMGVDAAKSESGGELALNEVRNKAVEMLETVDGYSKDHREARVALSIELLDALVRIEYDFVGSVLERALSALINVPSSLTHLVTTISSEFLAHVLEYHTKTRTVHTYALALLSAIAASSASLISRMSTSQSMTSTFALASHLPALARALRTSLTPTQTTPLATAVLQAVAGAWSAFRGVDEEERSAKKRKVTEDMDESGYEATLVPVQARTFSYTGHVAGTILSSLPASAYAKDGGYSLEHLWSDVGKLGWTVVWDCLGEETRHDLVEGKHIKKRKNAVERGTCAAVQSHMVASAALRFLYDVRARVSFPLGDHDWLGEAQVETLLSTARHETSDPELVLEIIRTLPWYAWYTHNRKCKKQMETQPIFTMVSDIITARPLSSSRWSGISAALTHDNLGLAALYVLTERWIDVLDALASTENLKRVISPLLVVSLDSPDEDAGDKLAEIDPEEDHTVVTLRGILLSIVRNAQFWELHNIRGVFLSSVLTLTAPLSRHLPAAGVESPSPMASIAQTELTPMCNVYSLLRYVPPEYFTRPVRTELVKRAMVADIQICMKLEGAGERRSGSKRKDLDRSDSERRGKSDTEETAGKALAVELQLWSRRLMSVRVFLQRMGRFLGAPSHPTSLTFVNHLLRPPPLSSPPKVLTTVTLHLIQFHILSLLRSQEPEAAESISSILSTLITARPFSQPKPQETWAQLVIRSSILELIERVTSGLDPPSLSDQVKRALKALLEALESALSPHIARLAGNDARELDPFISSELINAWSHILLLRRWLAMNSRVGAVSFGLKLAASVTCSENSARLDSETCSSILGLLFEELWCLPGASHCMHLDVLVGFYAATVCDRGSDVERIMDAYVASASKRMSVEDFSYILDILEEGIGGSGLRASHRERLIHLGQAILHDAPQGTLKLIQRFTTRCLNLFAERKEIYGGSSHLKLRCLEFIARHCSDRPAAIRSIDLSSMWSLLAKILSGSSEHDTTTMFPIFHHIVTTIGALIRLRRDLVVHTLPHLSFLLRQLMMLARKMRPQLGAKQSKMVTDTFPPWLSASEPLFTDEARVLARLLVSLTTKTVPRTHAHATTESHKAESLSKPFAKHASYVLVAYVDAFNDPLCIINAEMRRELEPGLFALCEMVGEHSRDALMVSALDSSGKTIMKSLWKEYEKQRYVGKG